MPDTIYVRAHCIDRYRGDLSYYVTTVAEGDRVAFVYHTREPPVWATVAAIAGDCGILRFDPPTLARTGKDGWETPAVYVSRAVLNSGDYVSLVQRRTIHPLDKDTET